MFLRIFLAASVGLPAAGSGPAIMFIPNRGQAEESVRFMVRSADLTAHFHPSSVTFRSGAVRIRLRFSGGRAVSIEGAGQLPGEVNFLTGTDPRRWRRHLPAYGAIVYRDLYPGIDMVYRSGSLRLKSEFVVNPGADPRSIRLVYEGASAVKAGEDGALVIETGEGELREEAPAVFQDDGVRLVPIPAAYSIAGDGSVGFEIGAYDVTKALVIDPTISYSTYLGGSRMDAATSIATDTAGAAYITGWTESLDFPTTAQSRTRGGSVDAFVAKLAPNGGSLVYATYLGGSGDDRGLGIAVDASGNAIVTGYTTSANFPMVNAPGVRGGGRDVFVAKLDPTGASLVFSGYLGGTGSDTGNGVAVDSQGNVYVAGEAGPGFPLAGAYQSSNRGGQDAFVAKLSPAGRLLYSTYAGGASDDRAMAVAVDGSGSAYAAGCTDSTNFPTQAPIQPASGGGQDAFVFKLTAAGNGLVYSTYLGGAGGLPECGQSIAVDTLGQAHVAGVTSSWNYPLAAPIQATLLGSQDAFVTKLDSTGSGILYSTLLGGSSIDAATGIAVDARGAMVVVGKTSSRDFLLNGALQYRLAGLYDVFVLRLSPAGNGLDFSTYLGGSASDAAAGVAIDPSGRILVTGLTQSTNFFLNGAIQTLNGGSYGAFVTAVVPDW